MLYSIIIVKKLTPARQKTTSTMAPSTRSDFVTKKKICCKLTLNNSKKETKIDGYFFTVGGWIEFEWWRMNWFWMMADVALLLANELMADISLMLANELNLNVGGWIEFQWWWMNWILMVANELNLNGEWIDFEWWRIFLYCWRMNWIWMVADELNLNGGGWKDPLLLVVDEWLLYCWWRMSLLLEIEYWMEADEWILYYWWRMVLLSVDELNLNGGG